MIDLHQNQTAAPGVIRRPIGEVSAAAPPFAPGLDYTPPARGHWTIAHTPMLIPGSYMIYLCASACMRGVVLSALEDGGMDRFSMIILDDKDIYEGDLEKVMIDGITEIIEALPAHPPLVMPFTSCIHHFLACDMRYVYRELRERFPDITFVECFMIPTIRKGRVSPEEQMQINLYDALQPMEKERSVNVIGSNFSMDPGDDFIRMLSDNGWRVRDLVPMTSYDEYLAMASSRVNIYTMPVARLAAEKLARRLNQQAVYLPAGCGSARIRSQMEQLAQILNLALPDLDAAETAAHEAMQAARQKIGETPVAVDHETMPLVCSLARRLVEEGFNLQEIYTDALLPEDAEDLAWLQQHAPHITMCSTNSYGARMAERGAGRHAGRRWLAIGQKAAYFTGTDRFVNLLEYNGWWGFAGVEKLAQAMVHAFETPSDVPAIIGEKAFGCACMIAEKAAAQMAGKEDGIHEAGL
ncbi:MAG: nitrogenase [Eubacteriales bacterium]|nr:nitrogenase [Eubacteriales bacterium]